MQIVLTAGLIEFKTDFQKNKDWNTLADGGTGTSLAKFKTDFQKNKDWNPLEHKLNN